MAVFAHKLKHILISSQQASHLAEAIVDKLYYSEDLDVEELSKFEQSLVSCFWHVQKDMQIELLGKLHAISKTLLDHEASVKLRKMTAQLTKNHARLLADNSFVDTESTQPVNTKLLVEYDAALDPNRIESFNFCVGRGASAKKAFVAAQQLAEQGFVEYAFMKDARRYLILDTNLYPYEECLQRIAKYKFKVSRASQVFALILSDGTSYVFFREKAE